MINHEKLLSNAHAWLLDHLMPSLPVPTDDVVSRVIESSALEKVVGFHSGMTTERSRLISSQAKTVQVYFQEVMPGN
ncbi:hypothetical protein TNCV_3148841 [Trichonephila clavipes]|nr:hypothetical protein TNCV_3148841 [Trichonephila clavipes]